MTVPRPLLVVLSLLVSTADVAPRRVLTSAVPNDNRVGAGILRNGVLTVALEVRQAMWYPDGDELPGMNIEAFAEVGKNASVPGPLLRVPAGTEIRGSLRNTLRADTITFYVAARLSRDASPDRLDSLVVPPGQVRDLHLTAVTPGTYLYRAVSGRGTGRASLRIDGLLGGALVVDSAHVGVASHDRVMVIQDALGLLETAELGAGPPPVMAINGLSWPHTERLVATVGDTLRWRVINASPQFHPMHLHGFFYRVEAFDLDARASSERAISSGRMVVTQLMPPLSTMSIRWLPERAGNWLFHCHFQQHLMPHRPIGATSPPVGETALTHHLNHALTGMGGLVMGILVKPRAGERTTLKPVALTRRLRLVAVRDPGFADSLPSMRFVLEEAGARPQEAGPGFSPTIVLVRGEPVSIMVVNHLTEPTAVHWHGIELESYFDGVAGFSGRGERLAPLVAPGDSFKVLMTPPRSGTFIYHSHVDEPRQHRAGLAGALIVRDRANSDTADERLFFLKSARAGALAPPEFEINGRQNPDTVVLRVGRRYRLRFISLQVTNPNAAVTLTARRDSVGRNPRDTLLMQWRPLAKDAIERPQAERTLRSAREEMTMGETHDFEFEPTKPGDLRIEVRVSVPRPRLMVRVPIRVE